MFVHGRRLQVIAQQLQHFVNTEKQSLYSAPRVIDLTNILTQASFLNSEMGRFINAFLRYILSPTFESILK